VAAPGAASLQDLTRMAGPAALARPARQPRSPKEVQA
jgi:hypothetical protein